jgi:hypothetical protein
MKKIILIGVALIISVGCKTKYKYPKFDYNNGPNPCLNAFKDKVFFSILQESYKGTDAIKEINKKDVGNPYDGIYDPILLKKIDSIGKDFVKKVPPPSLCSECTKGQNYFMAQALHFYRSRELDSVAKVELKKFSADCLK